MRERLNAWLWRKGWPTLSRFDLTALSVAYLIAALLCLALLTGCAGQAELINALAKDPASNCVSVTTPYGSVNVARGTPGVRVSLTGGACTIDGGTPR